MEHILLIPSLVITNYTAIEIFHMNFAIHSKSNVYDKISYTLMEFLTLYLERKYLRMFETWV